MVKKIRNFLYGYLWLFVFLTFLFIFSWKIFLKGYVIGPFDLLVGFYHPYLDIPWSSEILRSTSLHFKNALLSDVVTVVLPVKLLAVDMLKKGIIPLWNPYILAGSPLLASIQSAVFYPATAFYFILGAPWAYTIYILLQPLLAFIFMYLFLHNLKLTRFASYFGALSFAFSSFFIGWLTWGTLGHAFLWTPLAFFCIDKTLQDHHKKYALLFIVSLVFSFFAGHTQTTLMVYFTTMIYLLVRYIRSKNKGQFLQFIGLFALVSLLVCIQLIPAAQMYKESVRDIVAGESFYKDQTLYFTSYLSTFAPDFFGSPVTQNWWGKMNYVESATYFGTTAMYFMLLSFFIRKRLNRDIFMFSFILIATGIFFSTQNPISYLLFKSHLPLLSSSTFSRYSVIFILGAVIAAALGFDQFIKSGEDERKKILQLNVFSFVLVAFLWIAFFAKLLPHEYQVNLAITKRNLILPTLLILMSIAITTIYTYINGKKRLRGIVAIAFILLLSLELLRFGSKFTPFSPYEFFYPTHRLIDKLQAVTGGSRYINYLPANVNSMYKIRGAEGGEPLYNQRLAQVAILGKGIDTPVTDRASMQIPDGPYKSRVLDLMSIRYFVDKTDNFRNSFIGGDLKKQKDYDDRFKEIWHDELYKIYINKYAVPHEYMYYQTRTLTDPQQIKKTLISSDFDPQKEVVLDKNPKGLTSGQGTSRIGVMKNTPLEQVYKVDTSKAGVFVVIDTFYPGWEVLVNGKKKQIILANNAFRAVEVPPGKNTVQFIYNPWSFKLAALMSGSGFLLLLIYMIYYPKRKTHAK